VRGGAVEFCAERGTAAGNRHKKAWITKREIRMGALYLILCEPMMDGRLN
jgi:hypothetical protein